MKQPIWLSIIWLVQIPVWILLIADRLPTLSEKAKEGVTFGFFSVLLLMAFGYGKSGVADWFMRKGGAT